MKKLIIYLYAGLCACLLYSFIPKDKTESLTAENTGYYDDNKGTPLIVVEEQIVGWGKGSASHEGYIGIGNGKIEKFMTVADADQEKVDVVFPGDWGSSGGGLTIASPNSSGAAAAAYEYCKNWARKKATRMAVLDKMDIAGYNAISTVEQLKALDKANYAYYADWVYPMKENFTLLIRTEEGKLALAWIGQVNGTYGSANANVKISFKIEP